MMLATLFEEMLPEEMLLEITSHLDHNYLPCLNVLSKRMKTFYDRNIRLLLTARIRPSRFNLKPFDVKELFHLCRVINVPHQLQGYFFITQTGRICNLHQLSEKPIDFSLINNEIIGGVSSYSSYYNHHLFLTNVGHVYAYFANTYGELGLGDQMIRDKLTLIEFFVWSKIVIMQVSAGNHHSLFLTDTGQIYACGYNYFGQLGLRDNDDRNQPALITFLEEVKIVQVSAGAIHSLFLTDTGQVYVCGHNGYGELGIGHDVDRSLPELIKTLAHLKIVQVAAGHGHSIFLTSMGHVYVCGLLTEFSSCINEPILINTLVHLEIIQISAGLSYFLLLTKTGQVYACGENDFGQLGLGKCGDQLEPVLIKTLEKIKIVQVSAGGDYSLFLTHTSQGHQIYSCGSTQWLSGSENILLEPIPRLIDLGYL